MICWHKRKNNNFDPYNVLLAIAINIPQRLKTGFVVQARVTNVEYSFEIIQKDTLNVKLKPLVGVSKSLIRVIAIEPFKRLIHSGTKHRH